jgi:hypothetical protein
MATAAAMAAAKTSCTAASLVVWCAGVHPAVLLARSQEQQQQGVLLGGAAASVARWAVLHQGRCALVQAIKPC